MTNTEKRAEMERLTRMAEECRGMADAAHRVGCTLDGNEYARIAEEAAQKARTLREELDSHNPA